MITFTASLSYEQSKENTTNKAFDDSQPDTVNVFRYSVAVGKI